MDLTRIRRAWALSLSLLLLACSTAEQGVTEVVVWINADSSVAAKLTDVAVDVYDIDPPASQEQPRRVDTHRFNVAAGMFDVHFPFSLGIERKRADRFLLVVTGYAGTVLAIEQKAQVRFDAGKSRQVNITLSEACYEHPCGTPSDPDWFVHTCDAQSSGTCGAVEATMTLPVNPEGTVASPVGTVPGLDGGNTFDAQGPIGPRTGSAEDATSVASRDGGAAHSDQPEAGRADASVAVGPADTGVSAVSDAGGPTPAVDAAQSDAGVPLVCHRLVGDAVVAPGRESHPQFTLDAPWGTDTVQAVTITPIVDQQAILKFVALTDTTIETLAIWGPAMPPITAPADVGFYLPSGAASMRMNMHYQNLGTSEVRDHSGFELCVTRTPRPNTAGLFTVSATPSIPAGAVRYQSVGTCNIQAPAALSAFSVTPFMHALATHIKVAGPSTTFLDVDYSYQSVKPYPVNKLPIRNGDAMTVTCTYTNGTANVVNFGENLQNELCFAFVAYYPHGSVRCPMSLGVSF